MKTTYVIHCDKCHNVCRKDDQDGPCPPERNSELSFTGKLSELNPYSKKFDGRHFYPNVGKWFDSHREYERHLKETGREIMTDGHDRWDREDEEYVGHNLRSNERKRSKTMYFT